jgi:hypothetical protein
MADLPLLPTPENNETLQDYINLQRQLEAILVKQAKVYEEIGHINVDLEKRAQERLRLAREHADANLKDLAIVQRESIRLRGILTVTQRDAAKLHKAGAEQRMEMRRREMELLNQLGNLEREIAVRQYNETNKWGTLAAKLGREQFGIKNKDYELTKSLGTEMEKYPYHFRTLGKLAVGFFVILKGAYDLFVQLDKAAWEFRKAIGMSREGARNLRREAEDIALNFTRVGVTIDGVYKATLALSDQFGSLHTIGKDLKQTVALMAAQLGVSEENSAAFLRNMANVAGTTMALQENMMYTAAYMSEAAGIPLNKVIGDIAKRSDTMLTMMSRLPNVVLRTAIEARRLNTTIGDMAKASRSLLDFSESVNAEMDASVLLGRSINLQRARELAYRRDLEGSTKEILRLTKSIDFESLDVFQQEAFARATGRSVDELLRMVQAEREWEKARRSNDPTLRGMVEKYEQARRATDKMKQSETERLKLMVQTKANQDRLAQISQHWASIMVKVQRIFLPIVERVLVLIDNLMEVAIVTAGLYKQFTMLSGPLSKLGAWVADIGAKVGAFFGKVFAPIAGVLSKIGSFFGKIASKFAPVASILSRIGGFLGFIFKWVPVLGWVITAIQFIVNLFQRFSKIEFVKGDWIGNIWKGIKAIGGALYDTLLKPFVDAWKWIKSIFVGNSPSKLALGMVNGVLSIATMMFDAITAPWRKALAWITDKIPGMGKLSEKLRGGLKGILSEPVEKKAMSSYVDAVKITPDGTRVVGSNQPSPQAARSDSSAEGTNNKTLTDILDAINRLNTNLENGKIGLYLDGQLLSATIARQSEFRGGYGVNKL